MNVLFVPQSHDNDDPCIITWVEANGIGFPFGLGSRGSSSPSSGSEHHGTLLLGSPSPWMLYFEQPVLSTIFVFLINLSLSAYRLPLVYKLLYAHWD